MNIPLWLHESTHFLLSVLAAYIAWAYYGNKNKKKKPGVLFLLVLGIIAGFFVDLDHMFDYILVFGFNHFNLKEFLDGTQFLISRKFYVPLHGFEFVILLLIAFWYVKKLRFKAVILTIALALFFHLMIDSVINNLYPKSYSIIYRAVNHFDFEPLMTPYEYQRFTRERQEYFKTHPHVIY